MAEKAISPKKPAEKAASSTKAAATRVTKRHVVKTVKAKRTGAK